jgi:hypothetical protein
MFKKIFFILSVSCFLIQIGKAQSYSVSSGGEFIKRIEYNFLVSGDYNLKNKTKIEKLFFEDFNAELEFFVDSSFEGVYGFRIVRDSLKTSYFIEVKYINNFKEVAALLNEKYPLKGFPAKEMSSISDEERESARQYNNAMIEKQKEESFLCYKVETIDCPITKDYAEKLYSMAVAAIQNFKGKGRPSMSFDGFHVTFRCIVEDELWTLTVFQPDGELKQLVNLCKQLTEDIKANNLNMASLEK